VVNVLHCVRGGPHAPIEIIFDAGAQRSVMMNPGLLRSIELLKGIAGDIKQLIARGGKFAGLFKPQQTNANMFLPSGT